MIGRPRKNIVPYNKYEEVVFDYVERQTPLLTIAKRFDVTTYQIREILYHANVPLRARGAPKKLATRMVPITEENKDETDTLNTPLGE